MSRIQERILDSMVLSVALALVVFALIVGAITAGANVYERSVCFSRTESIGFDARYSFLGGCQIEVTPDQWIPLDNYYFKQQ